MGTWETIVTLILVVLCVASIICAIWDYNDESLTYSSVQSYIEDLENMEKIDNIIELMKALFIGEYMSESADRFWGKNHFHIRIN